MIGWGQQPKRMVCNTIATTETSTNSIHNFRTQMVLQKCPGLRQNNEPLPPLSGHWTRTLKMINVDRSSSLCWGGPGQLSGQGIQLWAIALQMNILSQEDITTATTAAKTAKYKWPAALFRVYGNNIQKKKPEALAVVFLISLSIHKNIGRA